MRNRRRSNWTLEQAQSYATSVASSYGTDAGEMEKAFLDAADRHPQFDWFILPDPEQPEKWLLRVMALQEKSYF